MVTFKKKSFMKKQSVMKDGNGTPLNLGDTYQGGIVAYILKSGEPGYVSGEVHGIIAAPSDQSTSLKWYNGSYTTTGKTGSALGTGYKNTKTIIRSQGFGYYAAKICGDLVLGGYSDWYLPSKDELNKLYLNQNSIGGFADAYYWSSTEYRQYYAWYQFFFNGIQYHDGRYDTNRVRAIRAF